MSIVRRQLCALAALVVAAGVAQAQTGGMVGGENPGPGFMGSGSGSSGTVDGGMSGVRETPPGAGGARKALRRDAANRAPGAASAPSVGAESTGSVPETASTGGTQGRAVGAGQAPEAGRR